MKNVIEISDLGKRYFIGHAAQTRGLPSFFRRERREEFWALRHFSLDIGRGDRIGIIGGNGSGKSTLLKILSRITAPTEGRVRIDGTLSSLLEVGTGFHPELTGRENIFLNGAVMGVPRADLRSRFDRIVEFAGVENFVDTPVKRYSSGMFVRLAFSLAAHLDSEILLMDEVLSVGDADFQERCLDKMREITMHEGRTILFVSHNMMAVRSLCNRAVVLKKGAVISGTDDVDECIALHLRERDPGEKPVWQWVADETTFRHPAFTPLGMSVAPAGGGELPPGLSTGDAYRIELRYKVGKMHPGLIFDFAVSSGGALLFSASPWECAGAGYKVTPGEHRLAWILPGGLLNTLNYRIALRAAAPGAGGFRRPESGLPVLYLPIGIRSYPSVHGRIADRRLLHPDLKWEFYE